MKHRILILLLFVAAWQALIAQNKPLTTKDIVSRAAYPQSLFDLAWRGDADAYAYVSLEQSGLMGGSAKQAPELLVKFADIQAKLPDAPPAIQYISPVWRSENAFVFLHNNALWEYNLKEKTGVKHTTYPEESDAHEISAANHLAYTVNGNVYVSLAGSDKSVQVTKEDGYQVVCGIGAHRQEFGITKGLFWSPDGKQLAFYRQDQHMVRDYPLVTHNDSATLKNIKYPMAGTPSHHVTVGVYDVKSKKTIYLKTGAPAEQYLTNITWSPDGKAIYVAIVNRDQNHMWLNRYNAKSGAFEQTLFEETHDIFVEPEHGPLFVPGHDDQFVWFSERSGFNHLYLYDTSGKQLRQLTQGDWEVTEVLGFDKKGKTLYFVSTEVSALERHAYSVSLEGSDKRKITLLEGTHTVQVSASGDYLLDSRSSLATANRTEVIEASNGKATVTLLDAPDPLKNFTLGKTELVTLKAEDGTPLYGRLVLPPNFDPAKKYPAMVYVYGGPHAQLVTNSWLAGGDLFVQYMATRGFVCFTVDNRGSAHRGLKFEQATFRNLGTAEISDQLKGVEYLKGLGYVDASRMGVFGWSFGGFMTTSLMLRSPGTFAAGVAGGPVIDWKYYEIMYTERYMDTPQQNPEGYKKASLLNYAGELKGKLLMIHGLLDDTVVPQHSAAFVNECIKKGVVMDYFPYPLHPHNVRGRDRAHLYDKVSGFLELYLKP